MAKNKMNILQLHAEFRLPDDFEGSLPEAIRLMADFMESTKHTPDKDRSDYFKSVKTSVVGWEEEALKMLWDNPETTVVCDYYVGEWG